MRIDINGNPLVVEVHGREDGPLMIVHHGAPGLGTRRDSLRGFTPFGDVLRVVAFDARGSGESGLMPPFTHEQWVADVDALREHFGAERFVFAGGSYGGFIALEYAIRHPERLLAVVLRDTAAHHGFDEPARQAALASGRVDIDRERYDRIFAGTTRDDADLEACWREIVPLYDHDPDPAKWEARLAGTVYHHATHNAAFAENMPGWDIREQLRSVRVPMLITVGRHDWITPPAAAEEIAALVPGAQLTVFEDSGHSPHLEEPERFQRLVRDFLAAHGVIPASD